MKGHHGSVRHPNKRCGWPLSDGENRCDWCLWGHHDHGRFPVPEATTEPLDGA